MEGKSNMADGWSVAWDYTPNSLLNLRGIYKKIPQWVVIILFDGLVYTTQGMSK